MVAGAADQAAPGLTDVAARAAAQRGVGGTAGTARVGVGMEAAALVTGAGGTPAAKQLATDSVERHTAEVAAADAQLAPAPSAKQGVSEQLEE